MFKNKIALVIGGCQGIGYSSAEIFLKNNAHVIIVSNSDKIKDAESKLKIISKNIISYQNDVSSEDFVKYLCDDIEKKYGKIDIMVHCAAMNKSEKIWNISYKEWNEILNVNIGSVFLVSKYTTEIMKKKQYGKIVLVSSIAGRLRSPTAGIHYTASKAAVIGFTRQLAFELAPYKINVNCVCPGQTLTPMLEQYLTPEVKKIIEEKIPLGYIASPEQQAEVIKFLASDDSNYMTGAIVDVNGGQL